MSDIQKGVFLLFAVENTPYYQMVSIFLDVISGAIMLIISITMIGLPKHIDKKLKLIFSFCLGVGVLTCALDVWCYLLLKNTNTLGLLRVVAELDTVFAVLFSALCAGVIIRFLILNGKTPAILIWPIRLLYFFCIAANAIPPVFDMIFTIAGEGHMVSGPIATPYFACMLIAGLLIVILILINTKNVGIKFTLLMLFLRFLPVGVFFLLGDIQPALMLTSSFFLLTAYIYVFQRLFRSQIENEKKFYEQQIELSEAKNKITLSQIQPHFIYNTLTTIAFLCRTDATAAEELTRRFSDYLRNNIAVLSTVEPVPFSQELKNIDNYLQIEKARFGDRIRTEYDIQISDFSLPVLTVQPIVENAVKHGIAKRKEGGTIRLATYEDYDDYYIQIANDGMGFDLTSIHTDGKEHVGLKNVTERIHSVGGELKIDSAPGKGTVVTIRIPRGA